MLLKLRKLTLGIVSLAMFTLIPFGNKAFAAIGTCEDEFASGYMDCWKYDGVSGILYGILCTTYEIIAYVFCLFVE